MCCVIIRRVLVRRILASLFLSSVAWPGAHAAVWYVNANAPATTPDGMSWATAFPEITPAINAAAAGDEVWVAASAPAAPAYRITIPMKDGVAVYGGFAGTETDRSQRDWRSHVTVLETDVTGSVVWVPKTAVQPATLDGFTVRNGDQAGLWISGAAVIAHCLITGNHGLEGGGIFVDVGGNATIRDSTITGNSAGSDTGPSGNGGGIHVEGRATIVNTTITGNCAKNGGGVYAWNNGTATIVNSLIAFNSSGVGASAGGSVTLNHCDVYGNTAGDFSGVPDPTGTDGNIAVDPILSNPYHDVHLQPGSPCIDAGDDAAAAAGGTDIDDQPRIQGTHVDIGSDESDGTAWTVPARTWHVSPSGNDANDGASWAAAKKTVNAAMAAAQGPDEVWVAAGTYVENVALPAGVALYGGFAGTETARGERDPKANVTVVDGNMQGNVVSVMYKDGVVDGFTVRNGSKSGIYIGGTASIANNTITANKGSYNGAGVYVGGAATVTDNVITGNNASLGGGIYVDGTTASITGNTITGNTASSGGGGVYASWSVVTMARNTISGNSTPWDGGGLYVQGGTVTTTDDVFAGNDAGSHTGGGIYAGSTNLTIANDTITGNRSSSSTGGLWVGGSYATVTNTLVAFNDSGMAASSNRSLTLRNNDVYGNTRGNYSNMANPTGTNGNVSVDPLFVNRAAGDYHLLAGSPCIDAGDDSVLTPGETDRDGKPRRIGAHVDIGAYEYGTAFYTMADVAKVLGIAGGLVRADGSETGFPDAVRLARKVAGVDVNP